jgi:PadR family transcriptional regulator, regulatory protein AphA
LASDKLTPTSFLVLALVGRDGAGPHDIATMLKRSGRLYWHAAESKYYSEPKRLEALGYLRSTKEPGKTHARTRYSLTPKGLRALRDYLSEPAPFPRMQNEPALRLLAADLTDDRATIESLRGLLREIEELEAELEAVEAAGGRLPHRARYLALSHRLPRRLLAAYREWAEEVIAELGRGTAATVPRKAQRRR